MLQRVMSNFCRIFSVSQCQTFSGENPSVLCPRIIPVAEKFLYKRGGGRDVKIFRQTCFAS